MDPNIYIFLAGAAGLILTLWADLKRRHLSLRRAVTLPNSPWLDILFTAFVLALASALAVKVVVSMLFSGRNGLQPAVIWAFVACTGIFIFLWKEGRRQIQFQRPRGIIFAEGAILAGVAQAAIEFFVLRRGLYPTLAPLTGALIGGVVIAIVVPPFIKKGSEYHRILEHLVEAGESVQQEYASPTPECPNPEQWKMVDSQTTELEVLDFLKVLVTTLKPELIVETGTFLGYGTIKLAEGARANGFGRVITIEYDPVIYAKARERIEAAGLADWVECRNESSLESRVDGTIDFYFSDSALGIREREIRRLLPQVRANGLIAIHDASSQFEVIREAALRMEREGLLSVVMLPTPRGLVLAQKRAGRK